MPAKTSEDVNILERGNIYFFYRPRVRGVEEESHPESVEELQRSYAVLSPHGKQVYRLIAIGRKELPEISEGERNWGFVEKVSGDPHDIEQELRREAYPTKTRGERVQPSARPAGEGVYALVRHGNHTHLAYALELPESLGEVQQELNIEKEASYIVSIKNPEKPSPPGAGLGEELKTEYPQQLQEKFRGRRFLPADPPELLDYPGAEVLFIGASEDVSEELGLELNPQHETERTAEIFSDLRLAKSEHKLEPLFKGKWE